MAGDQYNLKTAASYINNLLLARGLLRDGKPIEFAHPSRAEGGKEVTMSQIINLVHDLILKRDRDQEHRESIAATLRTLRTEATRQTLALEKAQTRNEDLSRQLSLAQSQERSARAALRTAESSARSLREEMLRLKTTVQQVRTSCANDIRKRDIQMQRLKSHLTSQQRGNKTGLVGASITINPGNMGLGAMGSTRDDAPDVEDPEYSLKQETTEFLTQLSQSLSDENDNLIGLVRSTLMTLREVQGMPEAQRLDEGEGLSTIGEEEEASREGMLQALPTSYEALATDMDGVLDNLKNLLTNPNFVSLEEVEMREEEIVKLRTGWETMEARWRDTMALMDRWRKRIASGDNTINLEELKLGMGLGAGLENFHREDESLSAAEEEDASSVFDEVVDEPEVEDPPSPEADDVPERTSASDIFKLKLQPTQPALREGSGNVKSPAKSPRKVAFSASIPNTPSQIEIENADASELDGEEVSKPSRPTSTSKLSTTLSVERTSRPTSQDSRNPRHVRCDKIADRLEKMASNVTFPFTHSFSSSLSYSSLSLFDLTTDPDVDDMQAKKRHSSPHAHPDEPSPKLTVQDKLKVAQAEAEAAALAEGLNSEATANEGNGVGGDEDAERSKQQQQRRSPAKRTRIGGRPKRRKSTLTPEELGNLMGL
ncbi:hypothetical protein BU24DRAFT_460828 [Aaosphaeria arxii CBS 175.79]|uniref:NIMA interactive protein n=1 Tax=Aaosphaeria arxii CBS 175.79 TaxID=1450172 RepID=A0A6A5XWW4_9PLEO|nr:uncharacterized protein BU24DRAFT_460828 [Aaosphaeria arxii CBS 175.79]KAF2017835.1 hypothetical protein BU24DRAFT_460828 [Aaosphaeria arxii CBS 175.79]